MVGQGVGASGHLLDALELVTQVVGIHWGTPYRFVLQAIVTERFREGHCVRWWQTGTFTRKVISVRIIERNVSSDVGPVDFFNQISSKPIFFKHRSVKLHGFLLTGHFITPDLFFAKSDPRSWASHDLFIDQWSNLWGLLDHEVLNGIGHNFRYLSRFDFSPAKDAERQFGCGQDLENRAGAEALAQEKCFQLGR